MNQYIILICMILGAALTAATWKIALKNPRAYATVFVMCLAIACGIGWYKMDQLAATVPSHQRGKKLEKASLSVIEQADEAVARTSYKSVEMRAEEAVKKNAKENQKAKDHFNSLTGLEQ